SGGIGGAPVRKAEARLPSKVLRARTLCGYEGGSVAGSPSRDVTISVIAAEAGVSAPTVSRVLNGRGDVAPATRARIEELRSTHGYLRRGRRSSDRIGLLELVFNDLDTPWSVEVLRGVED